jgi:hypothetical protein
MGKLGPKNKLANINVTLDPLEDALGELCGKEFPCPLCGAGLPIQRSIRNKPYCTCNLCGIQTFFRGKAAIARLRRMANTGVLVSARDESAAHGIVLLNRLEQLKLQKAELERKRGVLFANPDVENTLQMVDAEIQTVQGELAKLARTKRKGKSE